MNRIGHHHSLICADMFLVRVCRISKKPSQGLCFLFRSRSGTVCTVNCPGSKESESSSHEMGVATVAPGRARVLYDAAAVAPFSFLK